MHARRVGHTGVAVFDLARLRQALADRVLNFHRQVAGRRQLHVRPMPSDISHQHMKRNLLSRPARLGLRVTPRTGRLDHSGFQFHKLWDWFTATLVACTLINFAWIIVKVILALGSLLASPLTQEEQLEDFSLRVSHEPSDLVEPDHTVFSGLE